MNATLGFENVLFFYFLFFFNSSRMITEMTWESPGFPMELKLFVG